MTKRPAMQADGYYHIDGGRYKLVRGKRIQVWNGTAYKTEGGLVKSQLTMNKYRRIVSKRRSQTAKREKRLIKAGFRALKGKGNFGFTKKTASGRIVRRVKGGPHTRKHRG